MSDGPMDRSDPSENASYGRTFILPMEKLCNFTEGESIVLKGEASPALEMSDGPIGCIGQAILQSDIYFTDGEMM